MYIPSLPDLFIDAYYEANHGTTSCRGAHLSPDKQYRYSLWRVWDARKPLILFIGLNPSTADATNDDPTIRRCIRFASDWGYGGFYMVNLFNFRSTAPEKLRVATDPIGPAADAWLTTIAVKCERVVFAWGCHGSYLERDKQVISLFPDAYCLGLTRAGHPKHPLYLPAWMPLMPFPSKSR